MRVYAFGILLGLLLYKQEHVFAQVDINFEASNTAACAPAVIEFSDLSEDAIDWNWDFGFTSSTLQHPTIFFDTPGKHTITLIITRANGQKDTLTRTEYIQIYKSPIAQAKVDKWEVCTWEKLNFADQSILGDGAIESYSWDLGNGITSTQASFSHHYSTNGTYPVSLQITDQNGCFDSFNFSSPIKAIAPNSEFEADIRTACGPPLEVNYSHEVNALFQHDWDFGDNSNSTTSLPQHTYLQKGSFDVRHIVTDENGCKDTTIRKNYVNLGINSLGIIANDSSVCLGDTVFLSTNSSLQSEVVWDLGTGDSAYSRNSWVVFPSPGNYQVNALIKDATGCQASVSLPISVDAYPVPDFEMDTVNLSCKFPIEVSFYDKSENASAWAWFIREEDGYIWEQNPTVVFDEPENITVRLFAFSDAGCETAISRTQVFELKENNISIKPSISSGCLPLEVDFQTSFSGIGDLVEWNWNFGNGGISTAASPTHIFSQDGEFEITLLTEDNRGCVDTTILQHINVGRQPTADFKVNKDLVCALEQVPIENLSQNASEFLWVFGDGDTSMQAEPVHGFQELGEMDILLIASDRGCRDTAYVENVLEVLAPLPQIIVSQNPVCTVPADVSISNFSVDYDYAEWLYIDSAQAFSTSIIYPIQKEGFFPYGLKLGNSQTGCLITVFDTLKAFPVHADFDNLDPTGCTPFITHFQDQSTGVNKWHWNFGNTDTTDEASPTYNFREPGKYDIKLRVENKFGCRDSIQKNEYIHAIDINLDFETQALLNNCVPIQVDFKELSASNSQIVDWYWDFGDRAISSEMNPSHTYDSAGNYTVSLTVTDSSGCFRTISKDQFLSLSDPVADFYVDHPINCPGNDLLFLSLSQGNGLSYNWDFGDGNTSQQANPIHKYDQEGIYDIRLRVTDLNGCQSEIFQPAYIEIQALELSVEADNTAASCPPLVVSFNASENELHPEIEYLWKFGDGATGNQVSPIHIYSEVDTFSIEVIMRSENGCADTVLLPDLIEVAGPRGQIISTDESGCPGQEVNFQASATGIVASTWISGDGGSISSLSGSYVYDAPGIFQPNLVLEDSMGCKVVLPTFPISIHSLPLASIQTDSLEICQGNSLHFSSTSESTSPITNFSWEFGNGQVSNEENPQVYFSSPGQFPVQLTIEDENGCTDSLDQPILLNVKVDILPDPIDINTVSIKNATTAEIHIPPYTGFDFGAYKLYRAESGGIFNELLSTKDSGAIYLVDSTIQAEAKSYCYKILSENHCGTQALIESSNASCTMDLERSITPLGVELNWNAYVGWPQVEKYRVYRVNNYDPNAAELIASLPGTQNEFLDSDLGCITDVSYRVQAVQLHGIPSWSDTSQASLPIKIPKNSSHMLRASVEDNQFVILEWEKPEIGQKQSITLQKNSGNGFHNIFDSDLPIADKKFQDFEVDVSKQSYTYRLVAMDSCGVEAPIGRGASSIHLSARQQAGYAALNWTAYEEWEEGILHYELELYNPDLARFETVSSTPEESLEEKTLLEIDRRINCYRLKAIERNGNQAISYSNEVCIEGKPVLMVANAFSPNGDGINDQFIISQIFTDNFYIRIFDRWGGIVFESNDPSRHWDGYTPERSPAPEGVYTFRIQGSTLNQEGFVQSGTITLIR